jgi:hypothetical protein
MKQIGSLPAWHLGGLVPTPQPHRIRGIGQLDKGSNSRLRTEPADRIAK